MRLHVLFNQEGEILAAARIDANAPVRARPVADPQKGHRAAELYVPTEFHHYDLGTLCGRLKVHVGGKYPELKSKD
jgi:hypothetical protein